MLIAMTAKTDSEQAEQRTDQAEKQVVIVDKPPRGQFRKGQTGNAKGRPRKDGAATSAQTSQERKDAGWHSLLSGLGTSRDKRKWFKFTADPVDWETAFQIYRGDPFAARIVEIPPNEMMREGYELCITTPSGEDEAHSEPDGDGALVAKADGGPRQDGKFKRNTWDVRDAAARDTKKLAEEIEHEWESLGLLEAIHKALCYERAYGGAAILIGADDGSTDLSQPLATARVKGIKFVTALEPREIQPVAWYGDPQAPKFGMPALFQLTTSSHGVSVDGKMSTPTQRVHESRLLMFPGVRVTDRIVSNLGGWGDSIFTRVFAWLRDFNLAFSSASTLISDFAQAVYKMDGLNELLVEDPKGIFAARAAGMNLTRDVMNAIMLDGKDSFTREQTPVGGLPDLMDRISLGMSAASDIPLPLFMGESPGGINASGASGDQLRMFYDKMKSGQMRKVVPHLRVIVGLQFIARGVTPDEWSIRPRPLWQLSELEDAQARKVQSAIDVDYIEHDVYTGQEVREARFGGDEYSYATPIKKEDPGDADAEAAYRAELAAGGDGSTAPVDPNAPPADPNAPAIAGAATTTNVAATAMNGAQITSLLEVITNANTKTISRESAAAVLRLAFKISGEDANELLGPEDFKPVAPPTPPSPFGGGAPGGPAKPTAPDAPAAPAKPDAPAAPVAPTKPVAPKGDA